MKLGMTISKGIAYTLCIDIVCSAYQGTANFETVSDRLHTQHLYRSKDSDNKNNGLYEQYKSDSTSIQQHGHPR
jgi:hypothetical protein